MKVEIVMTRNVAICSPEQSLNEAARIMWERDCGIVPVVAGDGDGRLLGVVTDRDVAMAAYTQGRRLSEIPVSEIMSKHVVSCRPSDSIGTAERAMQHAQVHRLPVVNDAGDVVGMLSLADIARATRRAPELVSKSNVGATLAEISRPRAREVIHAA